MVAQLEHRDHVRMGAEACHGLGLAGDAGPRLFVQTLGLDQLEGDVTVELRVAGEVDAFESTLTERLLDLVLAVGEGGGHVGRRRRVRCVWTRGRRRLRPTTERPLRSSQKASSIGVVWVESQGILYPVPHGLPVPLREGLLSLVEEPVDLSLDALAGHRTAPSWSLSDARQASTGVRTGQLAVPPMSGLSTGIDGNWGAR